MEFKDTKGEYSPIGYVHLVETIVEFKVCMRADGSARPRNLVETIVEFKAFSLRA